jgi:hypothetical protein
MTSFIVVSSMLYSLCHKPSTLQRVVYYTISENCSTRIVTKNSSKYTDFMAIKYMPFEDFTRAPAALPLSPYTPGPRPVASTKHASDALTLAIHTIVPVAVPTYTNVAFAAARHAISCEAEPIYTNKAVAITPYTPTGVAESLYTNPAVAKTIHTYTKAIEAFAKYTPGLLAGAIHTMAAIALANHTIVSRADPHTP